MFIPIFTELGERNSFVKMHSVFLYQPMHAFLIKNHIFKLEGREILSQKPKNKVQSQTGKGLSKREKQTKYRFKMGPKNNLFLRLICPVTPMKISNTVPLVLSRSALEIYLSSHI